MDELAEQLLQDNKNDGEVAEALTAGGSATSAESCGNQRR